MDGKVRLVKYHLLVFVSAPGEVISSLSEGQRYPNEEVFRILGNPSLLMKTMHGEKAVLYVSKCPLLMN